MNKFNKTIRFIVHNILLVRKYSFFGPSVLNNNIVYVIDGSRLNMGLADRFRQILGVYALCKSYGKQFKLKMFYPFKMEDYLLPKYDWIIKDEDCSRSILHTRHFYIGYFNKKLSEYIIKKSNKQLYIYSSVHFSWIFDYGYSIKQLYDELFEPNDIINNFINEYKIKYKNWDALHFRFINLLGDFNEPQSNLLSDIKRLELLNTCREYVKDYIYKNRTHVFISSDSITFLKSLKNIQNVLIVPGKPKHLDYQDRIYNNDFMKEFLDLYMLANSENITSVSSGRMYKSDFPAFAALMNNIPFKRVII